MHSTKLAFRITMLTAALAMLACENEITITLKNNNNRLVVSGTFTNDTTIHSIRLSSSSLFVSGIRPTVVTGARVYLTCNTDTIHFIENKDTSGLYQTPTKCYGVGGKTYRLHITDVDVDKDGKIDSFTSISTMPIAIKFDSLKFDSGYYGNGKYIQCNTAYYQSTSNGPDYVYDFISINGNEISPLSKKLGHGELKMAMSSIEQTTPKQPHFLYFGSDNKFAHPGDRVTYTAYNFTRKQYDFLLAFDNNTNGDPFIDNIFDQLTIPNRLGTNIEPSQKAGGYFMVYSISRISKEYQ